MWLTVSSVRGDTAELDAWRGRLPNPILWYGDAVGTTASVNGRDAVFVAFEEGEGGTMNVVLTRMEDGSLLVVTSSAFGSAPLAEKELLQVAASVRPAGGDEWTAFTDSTWGGPDLNADEGSVELARGVQGTDEWLLQASQRPPADTGISPGPGVGWCVDPCLKLLGAKQACVDGPPLARSILVRPERACGGEFRVPSRVLPRRHPASRRKCQAHRPERQGDRTTAAATR